MGRWTPDTRARLEQAALELFGESGFERTTVAEIAGRAGLTERTFFRHFADKREVLFGGTGPLRDLLVGAVAAAPPGAAPIDAALAAITAAAALIQDRAAQARSRQAVIDAHPELRERELIKLAALAADVAAALRARGAGDLAAALAAETGVAVFKVAYGRWIDGPADTPLPDVVRDTATELRTVTAGR
ncbi:helix-turn-helix domain-containing protein [Actinomadura atramentaria]|uniref:helix-turn-helix domain-containing protein n=1 Tax=Actinomadura atramentaria TaxID=1990 RepID=UPI0003A30ABC|nr:helix-turn-helix domain-containing protein [Actinomadura atramentaria]